MGILLDPISGHEPFWELFFLFQGVALAKDLQSFRHVTSVGKRLRL